MAYGFNVFNRTVSMDDLAISYFGDELKIMLKGTRWSQYFLGLKILFGDYYPTLRGIVSIIALIIASLKLSFVHFAKKSVSIESSKKPSLIACGINLSFMDEN